MTGQVYFSVGFALPETALVGTVEEVLVMATAAEDSGVDYLVLPDHPASPTGTPGPAAAVLLATLLAEHTCEIGLVVSASTGYHEPYNLARMVASLDHISAGRAGWWATSTTTSDSDANHPATASDRVARAEEHVLVVRALWDSWEDGAFVHEKETGRFVDPDRVHTIDHEGAALRVRGPLNVIRPPQGQPVVFAAARDTPVAAAADFVVTGDVLTAQGTALVSVLPFVAPTAAGAASLHVAAGSPESTAATAVAVGDPATVAGELIEHARGAQGVVVRFADAAAVSAFTQHVLPLLRRARPNAGGTLRARLGLSTPENRFATAAERS